MVDPKIENVGSSIESLVLSLIKSGFKIEKEDSQKGKCMSKIQEMYTKLDKVGLNSKQYGCIKIMCIIGFFTYLATIFHS